MDDILEKTMLEHNTTLKQYKSEDDFESYPEISQKSIQNFKARGFTSLFPIQSSTFNPIYYGEDVVARDLTGSGKTLAFSLPIIEYLRA